MTQQAASTWRRISAVMALGTALYGGMIAIDIATTDHAAPHDGEGLSLHGSAHADTYGDPSDGPYKLGRVATQDEIAAWDIDVRPDGEGLPEGQGTVAEGDALFQEKCAVCHGVFGEGEGRWPVLAGGQGTLTSDRPVKTVGSYWPYLSTVFDYVHRAMPFGDAQSLTPDEVYSLTAYILYLNDLVDDDFTLSKENFTEVHLPNEENFFMDDREESPVFAKRDPCMKDCKASVEITARAAVIDVTPEDATGGASLEGGEPVVQAKAETTETPAPAPAPAAAEGPDPALVADGEKVFKKCKACHQVGEGAKHRTGPILTGVIGRPAGAAEGFKKYSKAMKAAADEGLVWTEDKIAEFLAQPRKYLKGTSMGFAGLKKDEDIQAVLAYLKSESQ